MTCEKAKVCNVCEGTFKMERGCYLEKRCPACRIFQIGKSNVPLWKTKNYRFMKELHYAKLVKYTCPSEYELLKEHTSWYNNEPEEDDPLLKMILKEELSEQIDELLTNLNNKEKIAIQLVIMDEFLLREAGDALGVTTERIRQIISSGIKKLKHPKVGRPILKYLDTDRKYIMW